MAVRQCDTSFHRRARHRTGYFQIRVGARGQRIVARNQYTLGPQINVYVRFGQLGENNPAAERERSTSEIAAESFQRHRIVPKQRPRLESVQRRQSRVGEAGGIDGDVATPTESRSRNRSTDSDFKRQVAVELLDRRNELPQKIHRASRHPHHRLHRRVFVKRTRAQNFSGIERHRRGNTDGLNLRLLQFPRNIDFFSDGIGRETKGRRIKIRQLRVAQIPPLDLEMRLQIREGTARLQFDRQKSGRRRLHPEDHRTIS